jgi:dihydropteridine reductase
MLDTPQNRKDMPDANYDNWTPLEHVADLLLSWSNGKERPANGTLIRIKTENKKTSFTPVLDV